MYLPSRMFGEIFPGCSDELTVLIYGVVCDSIVFFRLIPYQRHRGVVIGQSGNQQIGYVLAAFRTVIFGFCQGRRFAAFYFWGRI